MADARHVDDTLFFVAEEDFLLYRADTSEFAHLRKPHVPMVEQALWQEAQLSAGAGVVAQGSRSVTSNTLSVDICLAPFLVPFVVPILGTDSGSKSAPTTRTTKQCCLRRPGVTARGA